MTRLWEEGEGYRVADYIRSLESGHGALCDGIAQEARASHVPVIRPETASFLKTMTAIVRPARILEVGAAVGYSALLMAQAMPKGAAITTIENDGSRAQKAREHFCTAGMEGRITLVEGDAGQVIGKLQGPYDLIFMDAAKGQYIGWLPRIMELMADGGVLFSDNVFQDGDIFESRFAVERRKRTIHSRMREYLYVLKHTKELETSIVPIGDGVALSVKKARGIKEAALNEED